MEETRFNLEEHFICVGAVIAQIRDNFTIHCDSPMAEDTYSLVQK